MIVTSLSTVAYRVHDPKWAFTPTSGAGAGTHGGRVNRPGINALYLSLDLATALAEYQQVDTLLRPALMVSYHVAVEPIIDFRNGVSAVWDDLWQDLYCDWRRMVFSENIEPPSWVIGDLVRAKGAKGILFKSAVTGGTNLALYTDSLTSTDVLAAHDPTDALPKNQDSWS